MRNRYDLSLILFADQAVCLRQNFSGLCAKLTGRQQFASAFRHSKETFLFSFYMRQTFLPLILLFSLFLTACHEEGVPPILKNSCKGGDCTYSFRTQSAIVLSLGGGGTLLEIENGENLVFSFVYQQEDDPQIGGDEYGEIIYFEIEPDETSFRYEGQQLSEVTAIMNGICNCPQNVVYITEGSISGEKIDEFNWEISFDLTYTFREDQLRRVFDEQTFSRE